ncbi:MAG: dTDP-glucose 4,6-dehydratase [Spirochaetes bacterium GWF1_31_7]|nr:MAG: dTDP-glucose 4,6-dehydratase [Spirochaetes bacterium GWE1_32_154]OHD48383.1 MAG: dTDP-glucose 4,6-dehydratase [Spirochaetes bacterium GWF1_31_7]OHD50476.1 MAG: dTDP-glucose 4,6-dehydratase [Spirochaetes bacterium GWE2_31_10]OHD82656.1 MAG: dTDP-glucose 4,6-dehydratase [Spirochaetes bacterium RIFOXYB1_FULL_32_8]HBD93235.1 dTDP-glucose 4,6-dehydratase [Spirochaetia bacterium]
MRKILVTGGTVFVSKYVAEYFAKKGDDVYVMNRNNHLQPENTTLINCDRLNIGGRLKEYSFDAVLDITAYTKTDIQSLTDSLDEIKDYIFLSSSAVYPETISQPFNEKQPVGKNMYWGDYGVNKIEAEAFLISEVPQAYILRPPYLYGPMNNVYREAFIFECAENDRPFYVPENGNMKLQFFYIEDLCKFIEIILEKHPKQHIFNTANTESLTISEWVTLCYGIAGKEVQIINVMNELNQRNYFCFYDYEYKLDSAQQNILMPDTQSMEDGLKHSYLWYKKHRHEINRRPYIEYIDSRFRQ